MTEQTQGMDVVNRTFEDALRAEPALAAVDCAVRALVALATPERRVCSECLWYRVIKPLASPWIGWERGCIPRNADDFDQGFRIYSAAELLTEPESTPAETEAETWLRSSQAFDLVTGEWLRIAETRSAICAMCSE